jgi:hypothetical protein
MNQDWRDEKVRELFHERGQQDERLTPGFATVLEAALRRRKLPRRRLVLRVAVAAAVPVFAFAVVLTLVRNQSTETLPPLDPAILQRLPLVGVGPPNPESPPPPMRPDHFRRPPRYRKPAIRTQTKSIQISQWHAPTDFLLKLPGSEYLRNLPRMPDSPPMLTRGIPENHN